MDVTGRRQGQVHHRGCPRLHFGHVRSAVRPLGGHHVIGALVHVGDRVIPLTVGYGNVAFAPFRLHVEHPSGLWFSSRGRPQPVGGHPGGNHHGTRRVGVTRQSYRTAERTCFADVTRQGAAAAAAPDNQTNGPKHGHGQNKHPCKTNPVCIQLLHEKNPSLLNS